DRTGEAPRPGILRLDGRVRRRDPAEHQLRPRAGHRTRGHGRTPVRSRHLRPGGGLRNRAAGALVPEGRHPLRGGGTRSMGAPVRPRRLRRARHRGALGSHAGRAALLRPGREHPLPGARDGRRRGVRKDGPGGEAVRPHHRARGVRHLEPRPLVDVHPRRAPDLGTQHGPPPVRPRPETRREGRGHDLRPVPATNGTVMDLSAWLNFISPGGPCFDLATLPIPGSPVSLAMIDALVESHVKPRGDEITILEIGSFCGISTLTWGYALERLGITNYTIYCVDIWYHGGEVKYSPDKLEVLRERNSFNHDVFKFNIAQSIGLSHVVEIIGDSRVGLARLRDGFFDVVYVDGYHSYDAIASDIAHAFRLCRPGGIICGDDYDCSPEMMQSIPDDARQLDEYKVGSTDIGVHPGVVVAVDGLLGVPRSYGGFWAFEKVTDKAGPPFTDCVVPMDVPALPRRIPKFIPPHIR